MKKKRCEAVGTKTGSRRGGREKLTSPGRPPGSPALPAAGARPAGQAAMGAPVAPPRPPHRPRPETPGTRTGPLPPSGRARENFYPHRDGLLRCFYERPEPRSLRLHSPDRRSQPGRTEPHRTEPNRAVRYRSGPSHDEKYRAKPSSNLPSRNLPSRAERDRDRTERRGPGCPARRAARRSAKSRSGWPRPGRKSLPGPA